MRKKPRHFGQNRPKQPHNGLRLWIHGCEVFMAPSFPFSTWFSLIFKVFDGKREGKWEFLKMRSGLIRSRQFFARFNPNFTWFGCRMLSKVFGHIFFLSILSFFLKSKNNSYKFMRFMDFIQEIFFLSFFHLFNKKIQWLLFLQLSYLFIEYFIHVLESPQKGEPSNY